VQKTKRLRADEFGQNQANHGVGPQVRKTKHLSKADSGCKDKNDVTEANNDVTEANNEEMQNDPKVL